MKNKYSFFATTLSIGRLFILFALYFLVVIIATICLLDFSYDMNFGLFFFGCFVLGLSLFLISNKPVKIILEQNFIAIYYWNRLKYKAPINDLKYIQGIDIEKTDQRSEVKLIFSNRKFYFSIWGIHGAKVTNDAKLIKMLVDKYQLQKEFYGKRLFFIDIYRYFNHQYNTSITDSPHNKKEK